MYQQFQLERWHCGNLETVPREQINQIYGIPEPIQLVHTRRAFSRHRSVAIKENKTLLQGNTYN